MKNDNDGGEVYYTDDEDDEHNEDDEHDGYNVYYEHEEYGSSWKHGIPPEKYFRAICEARRFD